MTATPTGQTIFIFDDDPDILFICEVVLRGKGYVVHSSSNCHDIVNKVKRSGAGVILLDNKIPPEGGIVAAKELMTNAATRNVPVVYFSANTQVEQLSVEAGTKYFIPKPFDINDLEAIIQKALADQRSG